MLLQDGDSWLLLNHGGYASLGDWTEKSCFVQPDKCDQGFTITMKLRINCTSDNSESDDINIITSRKGKNYMGSEFSCSASQLR